MKGQTNAWLKDLVSGEKVSIILTTNQSSHTDLMGAVITVSYAGNLTEYTWEGSAIQTVIPPMTDYTVSYSNVNGYSTPEPFSGKAIDGRVSEVIGTYNTELVTVNVSAEEGSVSGYEVTIAKVNKYGDNNEYTQVEYIESTGTQYIDTGFKPTSSNVRLVYDFETTASASRKTLFGAQSASNSQWLLVAYDQCIYVGTTSALTSASYAIGDRGVLDVMANNGVLTRIYKNASATANYSGALQNTYSLYLFANNVVGVADYFTNVKLYSCQIYDNGTLVRDYIPVINAEGVAGLLDKVNNIFYSSSSSTAFIAGDIYGEAIGTQTTSSATYKIPYSASYTIKASDVSGYTTPSEQSFIASQPARNVDVIYSAVPKGVFIQDIYGNLYTEDEWDGTQTANGIAVLADECEFVVALNTNASSAVNWGSESKLIENVTTTKTKSNAIKDYNGKLNTTFIETLDAGNTGITLNLNERLFPNGQRGYLGSAGEWNTLLPNKATVNELISLVAGQPLYDWGYWTSTQYNKSNAWIVENNNITYNSKYHGNIVVPFAPYIANPKIISFTIGYMTYQCWEGTTWGQWCSSAFNNFGWAVKTDNRIGDPNYPNKSEIYEESTYEYVYNTDIIKDGGKYRDYMSEPF